MAYDFSEVTSTQTMPEEPNQEAMTERKRYSLLLVDDHQFVRMALRVLLATVPGVAGIDEASSLAAGIRARSGKRHDLVLLDLDLSDSSGLDSLRSFIRAHPDAPVALLTGDASLDTMGLAMLEDIRGYIVKSQAPEVIAAAVGLMLAGERYVPSVLYASLVAREAVSHDHEPDAATGVGGAAELDRLRQQLTPRLCEVLDLIVQGRSNKEISVLLGLSLGTVKNYVSIIFERLDLPSRTRTINHVMRLLARPEGKSRS